MDTLQVLDTHECEKMTIAIAKSSSIGEVEGIGVYGPVIHSIVKTGMGWIAHNGEYATQVWVCPFCGKQLG